MHQTGTRWALVLSLLSWTAIVAGTEPEATVPQAGNLEPVPSEYGRTDDPDMPPSVYQESYERSLLVRWWRYRAKPALQYSHWGYPEEFEEIPHGARVRAAQQAQLCRGWAARLWLYRYDFCDESPMLNAAGRRRLSELVREFPIWMHHALVIESTGRPQLDTARCAEVAKALHEAGAPAEVVIGVPRVSAPFGDETQWWYSRFERQVRSGGGMAGGAASGTGSVQPQAGQ